MNEVDLLRIKTIEILNKLFAYGQEDAPTTDFSLSAEEAQHLAKFVYLALEQLKIIESYDD